MSIRREYFSDWKKQTYECPCGWSGPSTQLDHEYFNALVQYSCPKCELSLLLVSHPTLDAVASAAKAGDIEAQQMMERQKANATSE